MSDHVYDTIIIGGGPCGLAAGIEAKKAGLDFLILEKGSVAESIHRYPSQMTFFSTVENIAIGDVPFTSTNPRASRLEALAYYRTVVAHHNLPIKLDTRVTSVEGERGNFTLHTADKSYRAQNIILAIGYFEKPRQLGIPGEDLPHVTAYYSEPHPYAFTDVAIIGGGNSAVEAALNLYRNHARVTMIVRKPEVKPSVKYWIRPDFENRLREGKIKLITGTTVRAIEPGWLHLHSENPDIPAKYPAQKVIKLIGYQTDRDFLRSMGIELGEDYIPVYNEDTFETNVPGIFLAGTVIAGIRTERVFIENGRNHAFPIISAIKSRR